MNEKHVIVDFHVPGEPLAGDLTVVLKFRRRTGRRVDLDNLIKAVLDGLNGVVYHDDAQIVRLLATVDYAQDSPGVRVIVAPDGGEGRRIMALPPSPE